MPRTPWRLAAGASLTTLGLALVLWAIARAQTEGAYVYPIDDAYIHLAIAKNLSTHGVYGVSPDGFSAASSSLIWPYLLSVFYTFHASASVAWLASLTFALALPFATTHAYEVLRGAKVRAWPLGALLALQVLLTPLVPLALTGMEHTAHAVVVLLLALEFARPERAAWRLAALAFAAMALRYESAALCAFGILWLARERAYRMAGTALLAASFPPLAFAAFSTQRGWELLPNSVFLKARRLDASFPHALLTKMREAPHLPLLVLVVLGLLVLTRHAPISERRARAFGLLAFGQLAFHLGFGAVGWFFRYEAYLVPMALLAVVLLLERVTVPQRRVAAFLAFSLVWLVPRGLSALRASPQASRNIFDQEMQTARFLQRSFPGERVLLNDIGAPSFLSDARVVDLMGLANRETAKARGMRIDRPLQKGTLERLSVDAPVAVVYDEWFVFEMPKAWTKVGEFRTTGPNRVCAFPAVSVYATSQASLERTQKAFEGFRK